MSEKLKKIESYFKKVQLFEQALTHRSYHYETKSSTGHNEKFEFLGDAVLDLVLSELLMEMFPSDNEGNLSKKRASLVNEQILCQLALNLGLDGSLKLGKGEVLTGGGKKPRLLASVFEATVGALYLDSGFEMARSFIRESFEPLIKDLNPADDFSFDHKTKLQEVVQAIVKELPQYFLIQESGPSHEPVFLVEVRVQGQVLAQASGKSKKVAEQEAARIALGAWKELKGQQA